MSTRLLLPLLGLLLAACAGAPPPAASPQPMQLRPCDDGGSGGVIIDGVCL